MNVDILTPDHPDWDAVTADIARVYSRAYGARLSSFMPRFLRVSGEDGAFRALVGMRLAAEEKLFLGVYLDEPVEKIIEARIGEPVDRACILEIGNLAESRPGDARLGIIAATMYLYTLGYRWVVFTAVPQLLNAFKRLGIEPVEIVAADPGRLSDKLRADWGTYYDGRPMVCFAEIERGYDSLRDFDKAWLSARALAERELDTGLHLGSDLKSD